jgi:hypothetical protein
MDGVERLAVGDLVVGGACSQPGPTGQPNQNHGAWAERVECRAAAIDELDPIAAQTAAFWGRGEEGGELSRPAGIQTAVLEMDLGEPTAALAREMRGDLGSHVLNLTILGASNLSTGRSCRTALFGCNPYCILSWGDSKSAPTAVRRRACNPTVGTCIRLRARLPVLGARVD